MPALDIAGAIASVAGFFLSLWVLSVAKDARQAARAAMALAQKRDLAEELDYAPHKLQDLGNFLQLQQWVGVQLRIDEILGICKAAIGRWPDHLPEERKNDVLTAVTLIQSIATQSAEISHRQILPSEKKRLTSTHLKASGLLNGARGEARRGEEGTTEMPTEKDLAFVKHVLAATENGKVQWEATAERDQFVASFKGKYKVLVDKHHASDPFEYDYWLKLLDEEDRELLTITDTETVAVRQIFTQAMRSTLNVDEALDEIMGEGDDIPFEEPGKWGEKLWTGRSPVSAEQIR